MLDTSQNLLSCLGLLVLLGLAGTWWIRRRRQECGLARDLERKAALLDALPLPLCLLDRSRRIEYANAAFLALNGQSHAPAGFSPTSHRPHLREMLSAADFSALDVPLLRMLEAQPRETQAQRLALMGRGEALLQLIAGGDTQPSIMLCLLQAQALPPTAPRVDDAEFLTLQQYLSEVEQARQRIQEQAQQLAKQSRALEQARDDALAATQTKSAFLANMSHEIRTPMNGILGMAQILKQEALSPRQSTLVEALYSAGNDLLTIINDILDISKIEAGRLELVLRATDLRETVRNIELLFGNLCSEKSLRFSVDIDAALPQLISVDALRLRQILINLLGNAVKFTPDRGAVALKIERLNDGPEGLFQLRFSVSDTGIGISEEKQKSIFQAFTQADNSVTRRFGGTGLGLAISSRLVEMMGGRLIVRSQLGQGACFSFELALAASQHTDAEVLTDVQQVLRSAPPEGRMLNVLLVEDNGLNQLFASMLLEQMGHSFDVAQHGLEALEHFRIGKYDVVLMDCQMPEMDGFETTRRIRALEAGANAHVQIIAMTAHASKEDYKACLAAGMDQYLAKPIDIELLREKLAQL